MYFNQCANDTAKKSAEDPREKKGRRRYRIEILEERPKSDLECNVKCNDDIADRIHSPRLDNLPLFVPLYRIHARKNEEAENKPDNCKHAG